MNRIRICLALAAVLLSAHPSVGQESLIELGQSPAESGKTNPLTGVTPGINGFRDSQLEPVHVDIGDLGMVVSDSAAASRIGRDALLAGGTAVDAAVATAFALAVAWPDAGNIGGGGFMMVRPADGMHPVCIDYRETAPSVMHSKSFTKEDTTLSQKAVGVPGTVRGLAASHTRFGRLPWKELVLPAAQLAAAGVPVDQPLAKSLNSVLFLPEVMENNRFAELRRVYGKPDGSAWKVGERLVLPDLSRTLRDIAENGPDAFYTGKIAEQLVEEMQRGDGLISMQDLANYEAKVRPALQGSYRGYTIIGAPPPSSGGTCVIETLNILEHFDLAKRGRYDPITIHLIAEATRRAFADRARFLGDPAFTKIPGHLTEKAYADELAKSINLQTATPSTEIAPEIPIQHESPDTTHFSIVDSDGMAVSNTYTLEATWGSRIVVKGAGFVLNNEMGDFNWFPGVTNSAGRIGTQANLVAGGKRMLSSQTPTIVEKDGEVVLVTGSPGGRTIINTVICILVNMIDYGQSPAEAVAAPRIHHQWFPDQLQLERIDRLPHRDVAKDLESMGHQIGDRSVQGSAHTIAIDPDSGQLTGVADYRRSGRPASINSQRVALWDFDLPVGTTLPQASRSDADSAAWTNAIADCETDGYDHLHIHVNAGSELLSTFAPLPQREKNWTAEIKIDSARLAGKESDEQLSFAFTSGLTNDRSIAELTLLRDAENQISIVGSSGDEATDPIVISRSGAIETPLVLQMVLDGVEDRFRIAARSTSDESFQSFDSLSLPADSKPDHFRMGIRNDLSGDGEYINVDRIDLIAGPNGEKIQRN